ncbi:hypothetical protein GCM10023189_56170 [Nibrella saemangeumensis]|uniref:DUF1593 domain-containing protein n=1 Tax=Nibrella saemangeumensis TaxID=1084526 RepID=A0ABP8NNN8_9BACT
MKFLLLALALFGYVAVDAQPTGRHSGHYRIVIMTDMTHDDGNSLIRYLYYASDFDLEALIVTPQLPDFNHDADQPWQKAQTILNGYKAIYPNLVKHSPNFPTYEALQRVTKKGRGALPIIWLTNEKKFAGKIAGRYVESSWGDIRFHDWIGEGNTPHGEPKDSEGSAFLQQVFDKDDDRPIFVQMWGGPITFVQALYRYRQRQGNEKYRKLLQKLHVFGITLQDITFDYLIDLDAVKALKCANMGTVTSTFTGERSTPGRLLFDGGHFWRYITVMKPEEVNQNDVMSASYDHGGEGDTPAFLYLLSGFLGLNDPRDPTQGSWGTRFAPMGAAFPPGYYSTCGVDRKELERWIPDARNSFLARLKWATNRPTEVNHAPTPAFGKDRSNAVVYRQVVPGNVLKLDASASTDRDGDSLSYRWYPYPEASSYKNPVALENANSPVLTWKVPADLGDNDIHLILEVRDSGSPALVAYRRVVVQKK